MADIFDKIYRRNQMETCLWQYLSSYSNWGDKSKIPPMPRVFSSRIKKLLNLDREQNDQFVFFTEEGKGAGSEEFFSEYHIFMMGIALRMLDIGLKQTEVIFFLKKTSTQIIQEYKKIRKPKLPSPVSGTDRSPDVDSLCFMLINRIEAKEIYNVTVVKKSDPLIFKPKFVYGIEGLSKEIEDRPNDYGHFAAIELADLALAIPSIVKDIAPMGRGRPKS